MPILQYCTTASRSQLPRVRALGDTIRRHDPSSTLWVLLVDDLDREVAPMPAPLRLLWNEDLDFDVEEIHRMMLIHGELYPVAAKPFLIEHVLRESGGPVLFVDCSIRLYASLTDVASKIDENGIVLSPQVLSPLPLDDAGPDDTTLLGAGTFSGGVIGVGQKGVGLLEFLQSRLRRECVRDIPRGRLGEQRWLDLAPSYFPVQVLRDPGVNVAYWNLHERPLRRLEERLYAGDAPLRAFNFSGFDVGQPDVLSAHAAPRPRVRLVDQPVFAELCAAYRAALLAHGEEGARALPMGGDRLPGGLSVDTTLRTVFRAAVTGAEKQGLDYPPDPYDLAVRPLFLAWCELTYEAARLPVPPWTRDAVRALRASAVQPPLPDEGRALPPPPAPRTEGDDEALALLLRRLVDSSAAAISNLDSRLVALERHFGELVGSR